MARKKRASRPAPAGASRASSVGWVWLIGIFAVALAYRVLCHQFLGRHPLLATPLIDAEFHDEWAARILGGDLLGTGADDAFKPAGYPYFVALVYLVFGRSPASVQLAQYLLGAGLAVLTAVIGARLLGPRAGRAAGLLSALYAPYVFFESQLLTPALSLALNACALVLILDGRAEHRILRWLAAGLMIGASAAVRPDVLPAAGLVLLSSYGIATRERKERSVMPLLAVAAGVLAIVAVSTARNYRLTGAAVPFSTNAGINFFVGNGPGASGIDAVPVGLRWEQLVESVPDEIAADPVASSRWWLRRTWTSMLEGPVDGLARIGVKALALVNRRELRNNVCYHFVQREVWPLRLPFVQYAIVFPLGVAGLTLLLWRAGRDERRAAIFCISWIAGYAAVGLLFFVNARYRLPLVPRLIVPAGYLLAHISELGHARARRRLIGMGAAFALAAALCWPLWLGPPSAGWVRDYTNLGRRMTEARRLDTAEDLLRAAVAIDGSDPDARLQLARALAGKGQHTVALEHLAVARAVMPRADRLLLASAEISSLAGDDAS
ncbi:MAG: glycosyltransferase family 39 protein, partial [Acidobacteriota bacterium]